MPERTRAAHAVLTDVVTLLSELEFAGDPDQRVWFAELVGDGLARPVECLRKNMRLDLVGIARDALAQPGGGEALTSAVRLLCGDAAAEDVLRTLSPPVLPAGLFDERTEAQVRELLRRFGEADTRRLRDLTARWTGLDLSADRSAPVLFDELLDHAAQPDGVPPAVVLLECAARVNERLAQRLGLVCDDWAGRQGALAALAARRAEMADSQADPSVPKCLVVMLEPADDGTGEVHVRHWINDVAGVWAPRQGECVTVAPHRLHRAVGQALARGDALWARTPDSDHEIPAYVEFVLPFHLLNLDMAALDVSEGGASPLPLGLAYGVHLRSLERMRQASSRQMRLWRERWKVAHSGDVAQRLIWRQEDSGRGGWLAGLRADNKVAVVELRGAAVEDQALPALREAVYEGIGVAIWDRRETWPAETGATVRQLLSHAVRQLPYQVYRERIAAAADADGAGQLGRHIAVLWDDPYRLVDRDALHDHEEEEVPA
ncbi:hypothetical protein WEB32_07830 [Streptomyces netropsis]|uniref:VMAP-C domain-containing protein n=1 Tax=Streptomyces netropsis TaxID=55404 RepID=UPI0030D289EA